MPLLRIHCGLRGTRSRFFSLKAAFDFVLQRDLFKSNYAYISGSKKAPYTVTPPRVYPRSITDIRATNSACDGLAGHHLDLVGLDSAVATGDIQRAGALDRLLGPEFQFLDDEKICVVHGLSTLPVSVEPVQKDHENDVSDENISTQSHGIPGTNTAAISAENQVSGIRSMAEVFQKGGNTDFIPNISHSIHDSGSFKRESSSSKKGLKTIKNPKSSSTRLPLGTPASPTSSIINTDRLRALGKQLFAVRLCASALFVNELHLSQPSEALEESMTLLDDQQNIVDFMKANLLYKCVVPYRGVNRPTKEAHGKKVNEERVRLRDETCVGAFYTMVGILAVKHGKLVEPFIDETLIHGAKGIISMAMQRATKSGGAR